MVEISMDSLDIAIGALDDKARAGWAKAYKLEQELSEAMAELADVKRDRDVYRKLFAFTRGILKHFAPALAPWTDPSEPGLWDFQGQILSDTDDPVQCRISGEAVARQWAGRDRAEKFNLNWRAVEHDDWYRDPNAKVPRCACGKATWDHSGPDEPCLKDPRP